MKKPKYCKLKFNEISETSGRFYISGTVGKGKGREFMITMTYEEIIDFPNADMYLGHGMLTLYKPEKES
ncbi:hypothetical protein LCGC14_1713700 [marine sediment metagenome]|uniref:Uncharacterized protein n=1 Tax=marine sediment metagenome TaxID=412755 RepID=A0A0F9HEY5_9ZZZZ